MAELDALRSRLREFDSIVVAFSGGADSAFLAWVANDTLGPDRVLAATAVSPSLADEERDDCRRLADEWALRWREVETTELDDAAYRVNDGDRCYWCKSSLMDALEPIARRCTGATVALGVNLDDLGDHRPGQRAADERGAVFPLVDAGFTKADVRAWSRRSGCARGTSRRRPASRRGCRTEPTVTVDVLGRVERAERGAAPCSASVSVRVRHYGDSARVEVPLETCRALVAARDDVVAAVKAAGYALRDPRPRGPALRQPQPALP